MTKRDGCRQGAEAEAGGVFVRYINQSVPAHDHWFDHATFCLVEPVTVRLDYPEGGGVEHVLRVGGVVHVPAHAMHSIIIPEGSGGRAMCVYPARNDVDAYATRSLG